MESRDEGVGVVVVGGGPAAAECVAALRMAGYAGRLTLVCAEPVLPYGPPSLSKSYLLGRSTEEDILVRPESAYRDHGIEVHSSVTAVAVDRVARRVALSDGRSLRYRYLVLATGGRPRPLPVPGADGSRHVHYLRTLTDAAALRSALQPGARLVVVGGGYLGLEVASVGRRLGVSVTVVEAQSRLLARVAPAPVSSFFERLHREEGVDLRLGAAVAEVVDEAGCEEASRSGGASVSVRLTSGELLHADAVLAGIGQLPRVDLAAEAGLDVADGVVVDEHCRTSDPAILAVGDCTNHPCAQTGGRRRLESLPNAIGQASAAAATIVGRPEPYTSTPWFWSEQYDVTLQTVGLAGPDDEVVLRGTPDHGRSFAAFSLREGRVRAADVVSNAREFAVAKRLVASQVRVDPVRLADTTIPLKALLTESPAADVATGPVPRSLRHLPRQTKEPR